MILHNTRGEKNRRAKLTRPEVRAICQQGLNGVEAKSLAALFGVTPDVIHRIKAGRSWFADTADIRGKFKRSSHPH